jgi:hypothetical protein
VVPPALFRRRVAALLGGLARDPRRFGALSNRKLAGVVSFVFVSAQVFDLVGWQAAQFTFG